MDVQTSADFCIPETPVQSFETGDVVLSSEPWVWSLQWKAYAYICAYCFKEREAGELRTCAGCKLHRYCDETCQKADWKKEHKAECSMLKGLGSRARALDCSVYTSDCVAVEEYAIRFGSETFILVAKILRKAEVPVFCLEKKSVEEMLASFPSYPKSEIMDFVLRAADHPFYKLILLEIAPSAGLSPLEECVRIIQANAFPILAPCCKCRYRGVALFPQASHLAMTPVCWDTNVTMDFQGRTLFVHATEDIPYYTGLNQLRYSELILDQFLMARNERRKKFEKLYGYPCSCRKCTMQYEAEINPLRCTTQTCSERIPSDERALAPCPQCGVTNGLRLARFRQYAEKYDQICATISGDSAEKAKGELFEEMGKYATFHTAAHIRLLCGWHLATKLAANGDRRGWRVIQQLIPCVRAVYPKYHVGHADCLWLAAKCPPDGLDKIISLPWAQQSEEMRKEIAPWIGYYRMAGALASRSAEEAVEIYARLRGTDSREAEKCRRVAAEAKTLFDDERKALDLHYAMAKPERTE